MIKLIGIKTNKGIFISEMAKNYQGTEKPSCLPSNLRIDGGDPQSTFNTKWKLIEKEPTKVQRLVPVPRDNYRYVLIDPACKSAKIKEEYKREDIAEFDKEDYCWIFKDEFSIYRSLYREVCDRHDPVLEDVDFEYKEVFNVDLIEDPGGFSFEVMAGEWKQDGTKFLKEVDIKHQILDEIVFPDILLPTRPSKLTKKQTFDIIRQHVLNNIDGRVARVTSDYDFCFTVKKIIPLAKVKKYTVDVNAGYPRRKKKLQERLQKERSVSIFEMAPKSYQDYPIVSEFKGNTHKELQKNIEDYCEQLISFINEPVKECTKCNGLGVVDFKLPKENK